MPKITKSLAEYIGEAITKDYLITIAVTSYTQAKYQSANLPFGLGKTTLVLELAYLLNGGSVKDCFSNSAIWEKVHKICAYNPKDMATLLNPDSKERKNCIIWDDVQLTAPASSSVPIPIRKLANYISCDRPEVACIFFTTPNLNAIAAPLRKLVNFEIIISERGYYEVHKISYYKDFYRPLQDKMHFDYVGEIQRDSPYPPLPTTEQVWYNAWRTAQKKQLYPDMMKEIDQYTRLTTPQEITEATIEGRVIKAAHGKYYVKVPDEYKDKYIKTVVVTS
jgi:hypothetical protein